MQQEVFFLPMSDGRRGQRLCIFHPASAKEAIGAFLYIHPYAEEMNKSRRMASQQARALAGAGHAVLQIDLLGCGDSSGDFGDATWGDWIDDVVEAAQWLRSRVAAPLWLWGLRAGCLLAAEAAAKIDAPCNFLFWQAPANGKPLLQQFLRLSAAGDMLEGRSKGVMERMRDSLSRDESVEIAGYRLSSALARGLEASTLAAPRNARRLEWIEIAGTPGADLSIAGARSVAAWRQSGVAVRTRVAQGPAFWQTVEIEDAPALIEASMEACLQPMEAVPA
jgi:exosortase A-associated hydrolase 2